MFATLAGMAGMTLLVQALLAYLLLPEGRGAYAVCIVFGTILGSILSPRRAGGRPVFCRRRAGKRLSMRLLSPGDLSGRRGAWPARCRRP